MLALRDYMREYEGRHLLLTRQGLRGQRQISNSQTVRQPVMYELDDIDQVIRIPYEGFKEFVRKQGLPVTSVMDGVIQFLSPISEPFGRGTIMKGPPIEMLIIPAPTTPMFASMFRSSNNRS